MPSVTVRSSRIAETGVFTVEGVRSGEVIRAFELEREITHESPLRPERGERPEHSSRIDGRTFLVGVPDRYFNHSCDPNVYLRYDGDGIEVVARRSIAAGSELTLDYLISNPGGNSWPCHCGASRCRGETGISFFTLPEELQREYFPLLAPWFREKYAGRLEALTREPAVSGGRRNDRMARISHLVRIRATPEEVFRRVASTDGIAEWFTKASSPDYREGGDLELHFPGETLSFTIAELCEPSRIVWHCTTAGNPWFDTDVAFEFAPQGDRTVVRFDHLGWPEVTDLFRDCSMSWSYFLESLRLLLEEGRGTPESAAPACGG